MPTGDFPPFPYYWPYAYPQPPYPPTPTITTGCVCPPGANKDCEAPLCPRKGIKIG